MELPRHITRPGRRVDEVRRDEITFPDKGPIVQIGSALGSSLGTWLRVPQARLRILVACGAAGGIAATFNAPMAGVFFTMELSLRDFTAQSFGMVALASVTASVIGRAAFGDTSFPNLPAFHVQHLGQYALFAPLAYWPARCAVPSTARAARAGELPQRLPAPGLGLPGRHGEAGDLEAAPGHVPSRVASEAALAPSRR